MSYTYLKKLKDSISRIKDPKMKNIFTDFIMIRLERIDKPIMIYEYQKAYYLFAEALRDISFYDFTWESICKIVKDDKNNAKVLSYFLLYLIKSDLYIGEYKTYISDLSDYISNKSIQIYSLERFFDINKNPIHFYLLKSDNYKQLLGRYSDILIDLNTSNIYLREIMIAYINSSPVTYRTYNKFLSYFEPSLGKIKINKIKDFNVDTFNYQFKYYSEIEGGKYLNMLSKFYLFLSLNYSYENIFSDKDGIDIDVLKRPDFVKNYKLGFRKILYNPNDSIPIYNKWFLAPNGFERTSTRINANDYIRVDFDKIVDEEMKNYAKMWVWNNSTVSIKVKVSAVTNSITNFINFIDNFRKNTSIKIISSNKIIDKKTISQFEVNAFKSHIQSSCESEGSIHFKLIYVKSFIKFLDDNNLVNVEYGVLYILRYKKVTIQYKDKNIPIENLKIFEKILKEKSTESYVNTLYYALFHLAVSCELRISQLINLRIDSIQESMKKGEYIIKSITKSSKGENIEQPISARTKNHIDNIIKITKPIRNECTDLYLSNFLFLYKGNSNVYGVVKSRNFLWYLAKCCKLAGIPKYTPKNLRATYITKAKEISLENDWSKFDFLRITNHKNFDVVEKHYVGNQLRSLLEATYGIIIGDTPVKGKITAIATVKQTPENTVDDGCGICIAKACSLKTELGCPMCSDFIATVSNIPYFEEKIIKIDEKILNVNINHEVEHLRAIKKIYIAYIERLYALKEGTDIE